MDNVVHFELPTDDLARARTFYQAVFGWHLLDMPDMQYTLAMTVPVNENQIPTEPGAINGGMMARNTLITAPSFSVRVANIDEALRKIKTAGGMVLKAKTPVGKIGSMAYFSDTEGNALSLWENPS